MAESDRAARVAREKRVLRSFDMMWRNDDDDTPERWALRMVERECKRAVEEEREACALIAVNCNGGGPARPDTTAGWIAAAIRARK